MDSYLKDILKESIVIGKIVPSSKIALENRKIFETDLEESQKRPVKNFGRWPLEADVEESYCCHYLGYRYKEF